MYGAILLALPLLAHRCLLLGIGLYALGLLLGARADPSVGFARVVLQRIGVGFVIEGLLLSILAHLIFQRPGGPPLWATLLIGSLLLVGVPAFVTWQLQRIRASAAGVRTAHRPHWLLVTVTAIAVMGFLGGCGFILGALIWPSPEFTHSPVGETLGAAAGALLGLLLVHRGLREPTQASRSESPASSVRNCSAGTLRSRRAFASSRTGSSIPSGVN